MNPQKINPGKKKSWISRITTRFLNVALIATATADLKAGTATYDFNSDPISSGVLQIGGNGINARPWVSTGGNPGGFLAMNYPQNSSFTSFVFPDIDNGASVSSFVFETDLRIGNSTGNRPADGFSISFVRAADPILASMPDSASNVANWASGLPEGGSTTGFSIDFDTWSGNTLPDTTDNEGIIVRVENVTVLKYGMPTRHGTVTDATSIQTGARDPDYWTAGGDPTAPDAWRTLSWAHLKVELDASARLTVTYKDTVLINAFQTSWVPGPGRVVLAGRTGAANENLHFDNIRISTSSAAPPSTTPGIVSPQNPQQQNLLLNPSFEEPAVGSGSYHLYHAGETIGTGWIVDSTRIDTDVIDQAYAGGGAVWPGATDGRQFLYVGDILSNAIIHQDVTLTSSGSYRLRFDLANFLQPYGASQASVNVDIVDLGSNSSIVGGPQRFSRPAGSGYAAQELNFVVPHAGNYRLVLENLEGSGANVDNFSLVAATPPPLISLPDLVNGWRGDGNTLDELGLNNPGQLVDGATLTNGLIGGGFHFAGVERQPGRSDGVRIPDLGGSQDLDGFREMTLSAWIRPEDLGAADGAMIVSKYDSRSPGGVSYYLSLVNGTGVLRLAVFGDNSTTGYAYIDSESLLASQTTYHVVGVWRGGTALELYVNGIRFPGAVLSGGTVPTVMNNNNTPVNIGRIESASGSYTGPSAFFHGLVDEVQIYRRGLTPAEIQNLYRAGGGILEQDQTITFGSLANKIYGDAPFTVSATASSGLAPTFSIVSGPATINGSVVTLTGAGVVTVRASQAGNAGFRAATAVDQSFTVARAPTLITFGALPDKTYGDAPFTVSATASSGLAPTFSIVSGPATVSGSVVTLTGAGVVTVRASQAGDANFLPATAVDRVFTINKAGASVVLSGLTQYYSAAQKSVVASTVPSGLSVALTYNGSAIPPSEVGTYTVVATVTDGNYTGSATGELKILRPQMSLSNLVQAYDGLPKPVSLSTIPSDLAVSITYNGSSTVPIYPGTYTVVATSPGVSARGTLVITVSVLTRHASDLKGQINGSLQAVVAESIELEGGNLSGDLLVPGTPIVRRGDDDGDDHGSIGAVIVKNGLGSSSPSNYRISLSDKFTLRSLVQRVNPIELPTVTPPQICVNKRDVSLAKATDSAGVFSTLRNLTASGSAGAVTIPAGTYGNLTASGTADLVLGVAGATTPSVYHLQSLSMNGSGRLRVVGPVVVKLSNGATFNGPAGDTDHPDWLTLEVYAGNLTIGSNARVSGLIIAPNSTVNLKGSLLGRVTADRLTIGETGQIVDPARASTPTR